MDQDLIAHLDTKLEGFTAHIDRRFEQMKDQMDGRFEAIDTRFEEMQGQIDGRFGEMRSQMDQRFEAIDGRFGEMQGQIDGRFEETHGQIDRRFEETQEQIRHTGVLVEEIKSKVKAVAEGHSMLAKKLDRVVDELKVERQLDRGETRSAIRRLGKRVDRLEAAG